MTANRAEQARVTRARLEEVGRRLFSARGFSEVSSEELVEAAGVTRGALYHHFGGKEGLFASVVEQVMSELHRRIAQRAAGIADPERALEDSIGVFLDACADPPTQRILLIDAPAVLGWPRWRELDSKYGLGLLQRGLAAYLRSDADDAKLLAHLLLGALIEAAMLSSRSNHPARVRRATKEALISMVRSWKVSGRRR